MAHQVDVFCNFYNSVLSAQLDDWNRTNIFTPTLLPPSGFQSAMESLVSSFQTRLALNFDTSIQLIQMYELYVRPITGFGYSASALRIFGKNTGATDEGCSSYGTGADDCLPISEITTLELGLNSPDVNFLDATAGVSGGSNNARLVYVLTRKGDLGFDTGINNWGGGSCESDYTSKANIACSGFLYYLTTSFNNPAQSSIVLLPVKYFNMSGSLSDAAVNGLIDDMSVVTNWKTYFNTCAPASCTYTVHGRPSAVEVLTTILGVLGGVTTVLKTAIDTGVNTLYKLAGWETNLQKLFGRPPTSELEGAKGTTYSVENPMTGSR